MKKRDDMDEVAHAPLQESLLQGTLFLGQTVGYIQTYTPSLLCSISRDQGRAVLRLHNNVLPFTGSDIWTAYELSWLDSQGKPMVGSGIFSFPCQSPGMIESKSFKLYLNSFNQTRFASMQDVKKTLELDLSFAVRDSVVVELYSVEDFSRLGHGVGSFSGYCVDDLPVAINEYHVNPELLVCTDLSTRIQESLCSHLLKTNCPVTGQPDWASVLITYQGCPIQHEGLLKYICSYRQQADFHEQCIEQIFCDLLQRCHCEKLTVEARYLRRGGLDINPFRTNCGDKPLGARLIRQ